MSKKIVLMEADSCEALGRDHPSNKVLMKYIEGNVAPYVVTADDETILELRVGL